MTTNAAPKLPETFADPRPEWIPNHSFECPTCGAAHEARLGESWDGFTEIDCAPACERCGADLGAAITAEEERVDDAIRARRWEEI